MSLAGGATTARAVAPATTHRAPLAALGTVYRPLSCLYHLAGRFLHGWSDAGRHHLPAQYVANLWVDQTPENDLSPDVCRTFGVRRHRTVHEAVFAGGSLSVAGVLLAAEHGNYPRHDTGQILYPRFELFTQLVAAFHEAGAGVPVYSARQLSHDFEKSRQMVAWSQQMGFPLAAGSAVPFAERSPDLDRVADTRPNETLVAGFGPVEVGGFDAIEALQCLVERRAGGESGVTAVTCLTGRDVWRAGDSGRWSWPLLDAALAHSHTANLGDVRINTGSMAVAGMPATPAIAFLIEYRDGTRGTVLLLNGHVADFTAASQTVGGATHAGRFEVGAAPGVRHYDRLAGALESFFATGVSPAPIQRTLLTTGILAAAMESHSRRGPRIETPHLQFGYAPPV
ncbi:MAG: hypothetical protein K1X57_01945 [Gemmataceae bacterium]|nr:hypothetical protein [Gemmataceae bacterium]